MPKFTISHEGQKVQECTASGARIEIGSAPGSAIHLDDLLISLKQAVLVQEKPGEKYQIEPLSRMPAMKLDGVSIDATMPVGPGARITVEGYEIRVEYLPGEVGGVAVPNPPSARVNVSVSQERSLPPPLEPDLPPPLDDEPVASAPAPTPPAPPSVTEPRVTTRSGAADMEKTVFARKVGRLVAVAGPLKGQHWTLSSGEMRIGRDSAQNDIVIRVGSDGQVDTSISRRHASVHVIGDRVFVEDQGSAAGTYVGGRAAPPKQKVELKPQDVIEIRSAKEGTFLQVELDRVAPPAAVPPSPAPVPPPVRREEPPPAPPRLAQVPRYDPPPDDQVPEERIPPRRRRAAVGSDDNPFAPSPGQPESGRWPTWVWIAGAGVLVLLIVLIILWLS